MKRKCRILCSSFVVVLLIGVFMGYGGLVSPGGDGGVDIVKPGVSLGSYTRSMAADDSDLDWWKSTYNKLDGWITRGFKFTADSDGKCIIQVDVTTKGGELDLSVMDREGKELDSYKNIATSTFEIDLGNGGDYQIRVDARNHDGGFSIRQKTSDV